MEKNGAIKSGATPDFQRDPNQKQAATKSAASLDQQDPAKRLADNALAALHRNPPPRS